MPRRDSKEAAQAKRSFAPPLAGDALERDDVRLNRPANAEECTPETLISEVVHTNLNPDGRTDSGGDTRHARIARRAYQIAERRGFAPGAELEDWLQAEQELQTELGRQVPPEDQFTG